MGEPLQVEAFLGIGSNLGDREEAILQGLEMIDSGGGIELLAVSPVYETSPVGPSTAPFLNAAARIRTTLEPLRLLERLKDIERRCGRTAGGEWGAPRTLDLDILLYGNRTMATPQLTLPHPGLAGRDFALRPLLDLEPGAVDPVAGGPLAAAADRVPLRTILSPPLPLPSRIAYTVLDHTADAGIEVRAPGRRRLLEACGMATADLIVDRERLSERERFDAVLEADDLAQLVVGLLQEILYRLDTARFLPRRVSVAVDDVAGGGLKARAALFGRTIRGEEAKTGIKAATYHMLEVRQADDDPQTWTARIFFDV
jgi:2-amino-4-hydroxy-6-hydroxymethyldihydropteridine diphosphokinase